MSTHYNTILQKLALSHLDLNVHRRKWGVIISGLQGEKGESEKKTRAAVVELGKQTLGVRDALTSDFTACHRLKQEPNAPLIARFADLSKCDAWMVNAKKLKDTHVSISVDVPPCLRKVKKELVDLKKGLPDAEARRRSYIRHLPTFPYFKLIRHDTAPTDHSFTKDMILKECLNLDHPFEFDLIT